MIKSEDELAAVLAHECAHVVARHGAERITQVGEGDPPPEQREQGGTRTHPPLEAVLLRPPPPPPPLNPPLPPPPPPVRAHQMGWLELGRMVAYWVFGIPIPSGPLTAIFFLPNSRRAPLHPLGGAQLPAGLLVVLACGVHACMRAGGQAGARSQ